MPVSRTERQEALLQRFLRYAQIDTQSDPSSSSYPSSTKQLDLLRLVADELRAIGCGSVQLDQFGYVTATIPSTLPDEHVRSRAVPVVGFLAHADTSPDVSGSNVKPRVWQDYGGGELALPGDLREVLSPSESPELTECIGHDIVTSDGTTLLGADDKAGVAEIVTAAGHLLRHPEIPHGTIRLAITPDEEVGRGTQYFDVNAFGADVAYTMDGSTAGEIEDETFCADTVYVEIHGRNVHPGYAKGKLVNSIKIAAEYLDRLPEDRLSPETTENLDGYVHPSDVSGTVELSRITFIVRDFTIEGLQSHEQMLRDIATDLASQHEHCWIDVRAVESYRNMKQVLQFRPEIVSKAEEAIRRAGLEPIHRAIRGGTDGSRLTFLGLPTPNLFAGGHLFHSKREWVSLQDMDRAVETIVQLVKVWAGE